MICKVIFLERNYKRSLTYATKVINGNWGQKDNMIETAERGRLYFVRDWTPIAMRSEAKTTDVIFRRSLADSFASGLLNLFKKRNIQMLFALVSEVAARVVERVTDL